jgi:hypothetical protein
VKRWTRDLAAPPAGWPHWNPDNSEVSRHGLSADTNDCFNASSRPSQPSNAITCCFLSGFQVITIGRFWVTTEMDSNPRDESGFLLNSVLGIRALP